MHLGLRHDEFVTRRLYYDQHPGRLARHGGTNNRLGRTSEIEAFDAGHLWFGKKLAEEGLIKAPVLVQLCMGIPWGAPDDLNTFMAMVNNIPADWIFSAFSIGRNALAYPAAAILAGGNVRAVWKTTFI